MSAIGRLGLAPREVWLALLLFLAGGVAWWLQQSASGPEPPRAPTERRPDYVVEGLDALILDAAGQPERRLDAKRLRHYPDDGSSELDAPVLFVYRDDGPPWRARARTAWVNAGGDELLLQNDVVLDRAATAFDPPLQLTSTELLVLPELDYAETARFVEVERGEDWVTGTDGLRAWLGESTRIQVFGRVRSRVNSVQASVLPDSEAPTLDMPPPPNT